MTDSNAKPRGRLAIFTFLAIFAAIVGFTEFSGRMGAGDLVELLNRIFSDFDDLARDLGLEKIKTIGDAYMVCAGLPEPTDDGVERIARMALGMRELIAHYDDADHRPLSLRIGINHGSVVAGVIGKSKFIYDLWGGPVNLASRMESTGEPGRIHITQSVPERLGEEYAFLDRGERDIKGVGLTNT